MGSWNETCILTNLPIVGGGEVVGIFSESLDRAIYLLDTQVVETINIAAGKLDYYASLYDITEKYIHNDSAKFEYRDINDDEFLSFCYKDVWDKIVKKANDGSFEQMKKILVFLERIKEGSSLKLLEEFYYVARFLGKARAGFPENLQRGSQSIDTNARRFIAQLTFEKADWIDNYLEEN